MQRDKWKLMVSVINIACIHISLDLRCFHLSCYKNEAEKLNALVILERNSRNYKEKSVDSGNLEGGMNIEMI